MRGERTVMIVTQPSDVTADYVVAELDRRSVPVFRCNPGDFPGSLTLTSVLGAGWTGSLRTISGEVQLEAIGCAWYRRPSVFDLSNELNSEERAWALAEARRGFGGVIAAIPRWLNHPSDIARAEYKPVQLRQAKIVGLTVPATIITNNTDAARDFASSHGRVVYKPLSGRGVSEDGEYKLIYANLVTAAEITPAVAATAHLFQAWIDKEHEVRVTVVDEDFFGVRIDALSDAARLDWRSDYASLKYSVIDIPAGLRLAVVDLLRCLRLRFAALDFVVTPGGEWVFLEANPNGQWAWLQDETGLPIAAAIAEALTKG